MYKTFITILFSLALFANLCVAQYQFHGKIIDNIERQPLIGAIIQVQSSQKGTVSDDNGYFQISIENEFDFLSFHYLGYKDKVIKLNPKNLDLGTIVLERSNSTLDEVIVSVSPNSFKSQFKGSNFRINPITLKKNNPLSTEEILRTIPGVNIVGDMGLSNRPNISIRGSWGRRSKKVLLMEDGTPSAPAPYIAPGAYYNPVSDRLSSIEVYKGADMLRFGPNNMYGAINYITALPPQKPELRLKLIGGQRNYQTGLISYGGTWENLGALVEGVFKKFDGFTNNSSIGVINLNAKIYSQLSKNQSLYFKVSGQSEDNQASLSSLTPFSFNLDPSQNPLEADQFTMRRYGVDIIHKWLPRSNLSITSKIYATDFERDWWRQVTAKVSANQVENYVGTATFNDRYSYLKGKSFGEGDYVIVGRVLDGVESTTDSRWTYTVSGIKEALSFDWYALGNKQQFESSINLHRETFKDRFIVADSSRWARSGTTTKDLWYKLWSINGFIRNEFQFENFGITPILRIEYVDMYRQDLLNLAHSSTLKDLSTGREPNVYTQFLPGVTIDYRIQNGELFGSFYKGMIAPSKVFGFLVEQNGVVTNPLVNQKINITPEVAWNREIGWRGQILNNLFDGQITYFNNTSHNFYIGGRNEVFEELGKINIHGLEAAIGINLLNQNHHKVRFWGNINLMKSKILEGRLADNDLFSQVIHNENTENEYIDMVNANRSAYEIYVTTTSETEVLLTDEFINHEIFDKITKSVVIFGEEGINKSEAPYTPNYNSSVGVNYDFKKLSFGLSGHFVGDQFTEFHNFHSESADGAIGKLPSYQTYDAFINYDFTIFNKIKMNAFLNGKNLTNNVYRASRLNRATSGIFGGGFRQVIFGLNVQV